MSNHFPTLADEKACLKILTEWCEIPSGSKDKEGLVEMQRVLKEAFFCLGGVIEDIPLEPRVIVDHTGRLDTFEPPPLIKITKRPHLERQALFVGHYDTVFDKPHPFQKTRVVKKDVFEGPGVADMKGGVLSMLLGLQAFEATKEAEKIGWTVLLNPDEEVGSPSSGSVIEKEAPGKEFALIFEPAPSKDELIVERGGSANFRLHATGAPAHVGRDPEKGKSALLALASFCCHIGKIQIKIAPARLNVGVFHSGHAANVIPDTGWLRFNIRWHEAAQFENTLELIKHALLVTEKETGVSLELVEEVRRPPKVLDKGTEDLFNEIQKAGKELGLNLKKKSSLGVTDGNLIAAKGIPTIDTLGVVGEGLHTSEERMLISSLKERAELLFTFLTHRARKKHG